jgi:putative SOS response-associated peptidase YedK
MCGRYYRRGSKQKIAEAFHARNDINSLIVPDADYNVAPTTMQPVIRETRDTKDRELVLMRWGLVPFFTKALSDVKGISTINARAETVATSGTFRIPFERRRCLIPASGFYEWVRPESRPDDCPAWSHDRTCRPIGSTLGGQAGW